MRGERERFREAAGRRRVRGSHHDVREDSMVVARRSVLVEAGEKKFRGDDVLQKSYVGVSSSRGDGRDRAVELPVS